MKTFFTCMLMLATSACDNGVAQEVQLPLELSQQPCVTDIMTMEIFEKLLKETLVTVDMVAVELLKGKDYVDGGYNTYPLSLNLIFPDTSAETIAYAATVLWLSEHESMLELCWWKTDSSLSRLMILALILGGRNGEELDTTACPDFPTHSFNEHQQKVRQREIDWIMRHHEEIHALLRKLLLIR